MQKQTRMLSYLQEEKILDEGTVQKVLEQQTASGKSIISILKENNLVGEEQLAKAIAAINKIEFINLSPEMVEPMAAHMVTYEMANQHVMIPVKKENNKLLVAMSTPLNLALRDQIELRTGFKIVPLAATPDAIRRAITYQFNVQNVTRQAIASMRLKSDGDKVEEAKAEPEGKLSGVSDSPITRLVSSIIHGAIDARASDIHIEPQEPDMRIRYRIDGILHGAIDVPSSAQLEVISHIKITAEMDISERRVPQDGHISVLHDGKGYDLRVSSLPAVNGEKIVLRILDKDSEKWSLDSVVTSPDDNQKFKELAANPYGMILLTGPTGSGKTTTLYSLLQLLNTPERNIVTVEDPVEYRLEGITQLQVRASAGMTFAAALRSIVRQDPDVILIGEIRDLETAELAISAALTGHLVLSTMHTKDAAGAISRLGHLGTAPFLVSSALIGTVAQRLMRTFCAKCKQAYQPSVDELKPLSGESSRDEKITLYRGQGCSSCYNTGYQGRKGIYEILSISPAIRKMIVEKGSDDVIKQQAIKEGMRSLSKSAVREVLNGATSLKELMRVVDMREG